MRKMLALRLRVEQMGRPLFEVLELHENRFNDSETGRAYKSLTALALSSHSDAIARAVCYANETNPGCQVSIRATVSFDVW